VSLLPRPLRIAFFGTPDFAVPTLRALLGSGHVVIGVVCQPDRPSGRGHHLTEPPVKRLALANGLLVLQPERLKDETFLNDFAAWRSDLGVVAAYGKILTDAVLNTPPLGLINVHASLLPKYRGAAPVHRAVMGGETTTGVTIMRVVRELDAGPMLATVVRPIDPEETSEEVERDVARLGADLLVRSVDDLAAGIAREIPQDDTQATYAPRLTKADGLIDWTATGHSIHNKVRGLHPWPHAFTHLKGTRLIIRRTKSDATSSSSDFSAGEILEASGDRLRVGTGDGTLLILDIQLEGRRPMTARELLAGHPIPVGTVLGR
jgi:methionyl-tRNA formyltransferase